MKRASAWLLLLFFLTGCDLLGPSPEDVRTALDAVGRGIEYSTSDRLKPEIHAMYANAADATFRTDDHSITHNISFLVDQKKGSATFKGDCNFSGYSDASTGYRINGIFSYNMNIVNKRSGIPHEEMFGKMQCRLSLSGGRISTLDLSIVRKENGLFDNHLVANGKKIDLDKWDKAIGIIRFMNPAMAPWM
jgi:hypothetical protein